MRLFWRKRLVNTCKYICIYIYIHIYTYMYVHINIYILCLHFCGSSFWFQAKENMKRKAESAKKFNFSISCYCTHLLEIHRLWYGCCATSLGSLNWFEVDLSARLASSFRVICVLSILIFVLLPALAGDPPSWPVCLRKKRKWVCCNMSQPSAAWCSVVKRIVVRCSVLQRVLQCVLQCGAMRCSMLLCVAVCCSVLQCIAACCSVLSQLLCVAVCGSVGPTSPRKSHTIWSQEPFPHGWVSCLGGFQLKSPEEEDRSSSSWLLHLETTQKGNHPGGFLSIKFKLWKLTLQVRLLYMCMCVCMWVCRY